MWSHKYLVVLFAVLCHVAGDAPVRTCQQDEACVFVKECPVLVKLIGPGATAQQKSRLKNAVCGYVSDKPKEPKVCCPLLPEDCGPNNTADRIISSAGHLTSLEEFPWVVRLGYRSAGSGEIAYHCAGSLISNRFVLTAAHCVQQKQPSVVRLGEYDTMTDPDTEPMFSHSAPSVVDVAVDRIIIHPGYDSKKGMLDDIALVRLKELVAFSESVQPVCLPLEAYAARHRSTLKTVVGWRMLPDDADTPSRYLRKAPVAEVPSAECAQTYVKHKIQVSGERQLCAGGAPTPSGPRYSCLPEGGGPLTSVMTFPQDAPRTVLDGVVSFGPSRCAADGPPGVYTRVEPYLRWILPLLDPNSVQNLEH